MHPRLSVSAVSSWQHSFADDVAMWERLGVDHVGLSLRKCEAAGWNTVVDAVRAHGLRVSNVVECGWCALDDPSGWDGQRARLLAAFDAVRREHGLSLLEVYTRGREHEDLYQLAELLTEWDERIGVWRFRHFKVVARIIGEDVVGTQGTPVELLAGLIKNKMFPELWRVRTELTELAKQSD